MFRLMLCCVMLVAVAITVSAQDILDPYETISFPHGSYVQFSPDATRFIVIEPTYTIYIYDPLKAEPLLTTRFETEGKVEFLRWKVDNSAVLFRTWTEIFLLDTQTGTVRPVKKFDYAVTRIEFYQENLIVAQTGHDIGSSFVDPEVYVWDADTLESVLALPYAENCSEQVNDDLFAAEVVRFLGGQPLNTDECFQYYRWNSKRTLYMSWIFWNTGGPSPVAVYDGESGDLLHELKHCSVLYAGEGAPCEELAGLESVRWSPDGTKLVSLPQYAVDNVNIWDAETGELLHSLPVPLPEENYPTLSGVEWHSNTQIGAWGMGHIFIWDVQTGDLIFDLSYTAYPIEGMSWIRNGQLMVAWGFNAPWFQTAGAVWNAATGEKLALIASATSSLEEVIDPPHLDVFYIQFQDRVEVYYMEDIAKSWKLDEGQ